MTRRSLAALLVASVAALLLGWAAPVGPGATRPASREPAETRLPPVEPIGTRFPPVEPVENRGRTLHALAVLRRWHERRAAAYAVGDEAALGRLYGRGSRTGAADLRMLHAYVDGGLVVRGLTTQLTSVRVASATDRALRLRVVDRFVGARLVPQGGASGAGLVLPASRARSTLVRLERLAGRWVVASVRQTG